MKDMYKAVLAGCFGIGLTVAILGLVTLSGCDQPKPSPAQVRLAQQEETLSIIAKRDMLPEGAKDIRPEGGNWVSFTLERDGVSHRYLYRFWYGSHAEIGHTIVRMD